jgi:hypothetical protein
MMIRRVVPSLMTALALGAGLLVTSPAGAATDVAHLTPTACRSTWLAPQVGRVSGAAGTTYVNLKMVNRTARSCSLSGTPVAQAGFISYGNVPFVAVGPPATKLIYPGRGRTVVLAPNSVASVELGIATADNYPPSQCRAKAASVVRITFTRGVVRTQLYYPIPSTKVCTKLASTSIAGVALGTHFP